MSSKSIERVRSWLLGTDPKQQLRASQSLLALAVYAVFAGVQHAEVMMGLIPFGDSWPLSVYSVAGAIGFYAVIRSGLNLRLSSDRALTMPQILWALGSIAWSYAITGPARGAVLLILMLILLFGMFGLPALRSRVLTGVGFAMLAGVMVGKALADPQRYDPRVEALHLVFAGIVMVACTTLAIRHGRLRQRLQAQRAELAQALERIRELATRDELTGLLNRRAITERLHLELGRRDKPATPLAIALLDLDHFKSINDRHGHAAGDTVLRRFAEVAARELRAADALARWGGEEFLLMMPGADEAQATAALQRIRARLRALAMDDVAPGLVVTFSAGVALCDGPAGLEPAIEQADAAMYRAKQAGRDRVLGTQAAQPVA